MITFNIDNTQKTKYLEVLESLAEQAHALHAIHNPQTWKLSALTFALHLYDCTILFQDVRDRWRKQLPLSEAWDVDFGEWKNKIWSIVMDTNSLSSYEKYGEWKKLCNDDINEFVTKASNYLNGDVPLSDVLKFLEDKNTELSEVVLNMGQVLTALLAEIDNISTTTATKEYVEYYDSLMGIYMKENEENPYPIKTDNNVTSFDKWIASKSERQRLNSIQNKLSSIDATMRKDKLWSAIWVDYTDMNKHNIDKDGIGREIFPIRKNIISDSASWGENLYNLFSSLAVCSHLWEYEASQNAGAFDNLSESRQEMINRLEALIEKGDWVEPASVVSIKDFIRQVLGVGKRRLYGDEKEKSKVLWGMLENSEKGERVTFQNLIGYFSFYKLLPEGKGSDSLNRHFFGRNAETYQNINHGRPGNNQMPKKFESILELLNNYRPK
jgi:hypothetical protein